MSRSAWSETREPEPSRAGGGGAGSSDTRDVDRPRPAQAQTGRAPRRPPARARCAIACYRIRESEWHTLATVGTFRVVAETDLAARRRAIEKTMRNDLRHLVDEGLLDRKTGIVNHHPTRLVDADRGREGACWTRIATTRGVGRTQQYHAGLVKPKELAHDVAALSRLPGRSRAHRGDGGRVTRVVLDYELKRDYQQFLNRRDRSPDATFETRPPGVCGGPAAADRGRPPRAPGPAPRVRDRRRTARDPRRRGRHRALLAVPTGREGARRLCALSARSRVAVRARGQQPARRHTRRSPHVGVAEMTFDDRVRAVQTFGCSPRQARFLALVALHSGYCLRRQYLTAHRHAERQERPTVPRPTS